MRELLSKCGMNCGRCPSYRENLKSDADRQRCSDGWFRYHGFRITPAKLLLCNGCQARDEDHPVRYLNCYVRKCAVKNGVATCAHCSAYPCEDVATVSLPADIRRKTSERLGSPIPDADYLAFLEPYEGVVHLDALRVTLTPADIAPMKRVSVRPRMATFPDGMPLPAEQRRAMHSLHRILSTIECAVAVSYARQHALKKTRTYLLKLLWAFGMHGNFDPPAGDALSLEGPTFWHRIYPHTFLPCRAA